MVDLIVTHEDLTGAAANPHVLVDGPKWDKRHIVTGAENVPNIDTSNAANVIFTPDGTGAVARSVSDRLKNTVDLRDFGISGTTDVDVHTEVQRAINQTPSGGRLYVPYSSHGYWLSAGLTLVNKSISIVGDGWDFNAGGSTSTPKGSLFKLSPDFPDGVDVFLLTGTYAVTGMQMANFAILPYDNAFGAGYGRDAIRIDATGQDGFGHDSLSIRRLFIGNMKAGYSFHTLASSSNGGGALANSKISDCHFRQGRFENVGDSVIVDNPIIAANATNDVRNLGIYFYNTPGATKFRISGGNNFAFNGKIVCDGGIAPMVDGMELEQAAGFANTRGAMIDWNGGISQIVAPITVNCQLNQNSVTGTRPTGIRFNNTDGGSVTNTYIALVDGAAHHITQTASSLNLFVDHESNDYFISGSRVTTDIIANPQPSLNSRPALINALPTGSAVASAATPSTVMTRDGSGSTAVAGLTATAQIINTLSSGGPGAAFLSSAANASFGWQNPANGADAKNWDVLATGAVYQFRAVNDANNASYVWMTATRPSGTTVTNVTFAPQITLSALTASSALATDASKNLVSVTNTGSGSNVLGTAPTIATPVINGLPTGTGVATANTVSTLVARDGSGNFSAGTITASLSGNATTATSATNATNGATVAIGTNASFFPMFAASSSNSNQPFNLDANLTYNPSSDTLTSPNMVASTSLVTPLRIGGSAAGSTAEIRSTSGTGSGDLVSITGGTNGATRIATFLGSGLSGLGSAAGAANPTNTINVISANATTVDGAVTSYTTLQHLVGNNGTNPSLTIDAFGGSPAIHIRVASNTAASKSAVGVDQASFVIAGDPYDGSAYSSQIAVIGRAAQNFTGSNKGTYLQFYTTPNGSTTLTEAVRVQNSGGVSIGTTTDPGIGAILANTSIKSQGATAGIGYATGAGGAVTQLTSRTTGVTLNTVSGAITLVSAAGSATPQSFTVTNSAVAATDVPKVVQKSGTDLYEIFVTNVAAGSFKVTFFTTGGTTTEQPAFNFVIIKGVAA